MPAMTATSQFAVLTTSCSAFSTFTRPLEDWTKATSIKERRKLQTRIAQRKYRHRKEKKESQQDLVNARERRANSQEELSQSGKAIDYPAASPYQEQPASAERTFPASNAQILERSASSEPGFSNAFLPSRLYPAHFFPVECSSNMPVLVHHFSKYLAITLAVPGGDSICDRLIEIESRDSFRTSSVELPNLLENIWLQYLLADACFFYATLFAASSHLDALSGVENNASTLMYKVRAFQMLNDCLSDPERCLNDSVIAAVITLALFESLQGNSHATEAHLKGLRKMVCLRGGANKLGFNGLLARMLTLTDCINATLQATNLVNQTFDFDNHISPEIYSPPIINLSIYSQPSSTHPDLGHLSQSIRNINFLLQKLHTHTLTPSERISIIPLKSHIQNSLPLIPSADSTIPHSHTNDYLYESLRLAATIRWNALYKLLPISHPSHGPLVIALKSAILKSEHLSSHWGIWSECLCFVYLIGGMAARDMKERSWFVARLIPLVLGLGSAPLSRLQIDLLELMRWSEYMVEVKGKELWP